MDQVQALNDSSWSAIARRWTWPTLVSVTLADAFVRRAGESLPQSPAALTWWANLADHLEAPFWAATVVLGAVHALALMAKRDLPDRLHQAAAGTCAVAAFVCGASLVTSPAAVLAGAAAFLVPLLLLFSAKPLLRVTLMLFALLALWRLSAHSEWRLVGPGLVEDVLQNACLLQLGWLALRPRWHRARLLILVLSACSGLCAALWPRAADLAMNVLQLSSTVFSPAVPTALATVVLLAALSGCLRAQTPQSGCSLLLLMSLGAGTPLAACVRALALLQWSAIDEKNQSSGLPGSLLSGAALSPGSSSPAPASNC
ncbi:MAG: hypothetical protein EXS14_02895 [Planctomycetes bacterium]|nr:hypothetical protein [Planctomycetota bacterium]